MVSNLPHITPPAETVPSVKCETLEEVALVDAPFGSATPQQMSEWLRNRLGYLNLVDLYNDSTILAWTDEIGNHDAGFANGVLTEISVLWTSNLPTIADVIECFGQPDLYDALIRIDLAPMFGLDLWYLEKGLIFRSSFIVRQDELQPIDGNLRINSLSIVNPGTAAEMAKSRYSIPHSSRITAEGLQILLARLKPWPESWEQVEVLSCYEDPVWCKE
jgi:aryl carrier-like protein